MHCPKDTVVWVDPQSGMYYFKENSAYGRSGAGRYACRGDADLAGMHEVPTQADQDAASLGNNRITVAPSSLLGSG